MAIQLRRGTNAEWENTNQNIVAGEPAVALDSERFFVGTGAGTYAEYANVKSIAPTYSTTRSYREGDYVMYNGKLYICASATSGGAWNAANWEESSILEALTGDAPYRGYETASVSGNVVSFDNGAGGIPVKDLEVEIKAVQDLHGYDYPWVGGAGKNLCPYPFQDGSSKTMNGITFTANTDGSIKINGTATAVAQFFIKTQMSLKAGTYTLSGFPSTMPTGANTYMRVYSASASFVLSDFSRTKTERTRTLSQDVTDVLIWVSIASGDTINNVTIYPMLELGSTASSFAPYSNICPISGWDEVNVTRTGKNLFDISTFSANDCMYQYASSFTYGIGSATLTKNEDSFTLVRVNTSYAYFICVGKCFANIPVTISFNVTNGYVYDIEARTEPPTQAPNNDKRFYRDTTVGGLSSVVRTFTLAQDGYVYIEIYGTSGNLTNTVANLQYEFGSAKTDYKRGNGQTYTTAVNVWDEEWVNGYFTTSGTWNTGQVVASKNPIPVNPNTTYYLYNGSNENMYITYWTQAVPSGVSDSEHFISRTSALKNTTFTTPQNCYAIHFNIGTDYGSVYNNDISFNFPSTETSKLSYKGAEATANYMDTFGHGVYGGTLDVTTGVLTITHGYVTLDETTDWSMGTSANFRYFDAYMNALNATAWDTNVVSNMFNQQGTYPYAQIGGAKKIRVCYSINDTSVTTVAQLQALLTQNALQVLYQLATPQTIQLTAQQVETFLRENNIWADSGKIINCTYRITNT